jgi:nucleotide-binding universal stress UspA family protein
MKPTLLVPLDGSRFAEHALPLALAIAERTGATLQVIRVHDPIVTATDGTDLAALEVDALLADREMTYLGGVVKRLAHVSAVAVRPNLVSGPVVSAIREAAEATSPDLVVMTSHGRGPWGRLWFGSIADQLLRRLPMPVLLVRPAEGDVDLAAKPAPRRILIPLDGSKLSERILGPATDLGRVAHAEYRLLHVVEPVLVPYHHPSGNVVAGSSLEVLNQLQQGAEAYLQGVAERLRAQGLHVETCVEIGSPVAATILGEARASGADLIALETHGRGGLTRLFLGSVADQVLQGASTPVFVHHPVTETHPTDTHEAAAWFAEGLEPAEAAQRPLAGSAPLVVEGEGPCPQPHL